MPSLLNKDLVSIFIPTRGRAKQLDRNLQLLKDNTYYPSYDLTIIADADDEDTLAVCEKRKINCLRRFHREYFATKINAAFRESQGKYLVCLSDDVEPQPYWLEIALECFKERFTDNIGVLCFNDGGIYKQNLAIHPFISRQWIDKFQYGKWILWPDYHHFYGDTELTLVAACAEKYVYCEDSRVIHTIPDTVKKRDEMWQFIRKNIFPGDFAIFQKRCSDGFPGYGPNKIQIPRDIQIKDNQILFR